MNKQSIKDYKLLVFLVAFMWLLEIINMTFDHALNNFGLFPRQLSHLHGIVTMHFLHDGFFHITANSIPLLVLGFLICATQKAKQATLFIMLITGILLWLFGRSFMHVGASGLVMGYFGFLLGWAYFNRNIRNIILALVTLVLYGGLIFSLFDFRPRISFEGHIFGFIAGILSARLLVGRNLR